jgi:hypothetical protein
MQMVEAGFNPLQEIVKMTGESMAELSKRMERGGVSSDELAAAIASATEEGGRFFGMVDKRATTTSGQLDLLTGEFDMLKAELATGLLPTVNKVLDTSSTVLKTWKEILSGDFDIDNIESPDSMVQWFTDRAQIWNPWNTQVDTIGGPNGVPMRVRPDPVAEAAAKEQQQINEAVVTAKELAAPIAEPIANAFSGIQELFKKSPDEHEEDKRHREAMKSRTDMLARLQRLIEVQPAAVE